MHAFAALTCALVLAASPGSVERAPARVLLLVSAGPEAYRRAEAGVRDALGSRADVDLTVQPVDATGAAARAALAAGPDLVVAVGSLAAGLARERAPDRPLVYAMVLDPRAVRLPAPGDPPRPGVTGVTMEVAADRQLEMMRRLDPNLRTVGVLHDPAVSGPAVRAAAAAAAEMGIELRPLAVRAEGEVVAQAQLLLPRVDALWAMADPTVLTAANARALMLLALRARKPLFAVSEGFVRSGALAALAADPPAVGRRAGELAVSLLGVPAGRGLPAEPPPRLSLSVNVATARHLGIELPADVLAGADGVFPRGTP